MKTNNTIVKGLTIGAILTLSLATTFAMGGGNGINKGQSSGKLSQYITSEEKDIIKNMSQDEKKKYIEELKIKYNIMSNGNNGNGNNGSKDCQPGDLIKDIPLSDLTDKEKEILSYSYSEEMLARDVYIYLSKLYPNEPVFSKIIGSEQKHMDSVEILLNRYNLEKPINYGDLEDTYNSLILQGEKSLKDALEVGLQIEILDIKDLEYLTSNTDNDDLKIIFVNIGGASYNHMRSFVKAFETNNLTPDTDYSEFLSEEDLNIKGSLKYKISERLESKGIILPKEVSKEEIKLRTTNNHSNNQKKNISTQGKKNYINNNKFQDTKGKYKEIIRNKYQNKIDALDNLKLEEIIVKIDNLILKVNNGNYSDTTKLKYNATLVALKEIIIEKIEGEEINIENLFY